MLKSIFTFVWDALKAAARVIVTQVAAAVADWIFERLEALAARIAKRFHDWADAHTPEPDTFGSAMVDALNAGLSRAQAELIRRRATIRTADEALEVFEQQMSPTALHL